MAKKDIKQPELQLDLPAAVDLVEAADPEIKEADQIDDGPDVISSDLRKFNRAKARVNKALAPLKKILKITSDAGVVTTMEHLKGAVEVQNLIENKRKDLVKPYNDEVKRINEHAKTLAAEIPTEIARAKKLILDYNTQKEADAKVARTKSRDEHLLHLGLVRYDKGRPAVIVDHYHDAISDNNIYRNDLETASEEVWVAVLNALQERRQLAQTQAVGDLQEERAAAEYFGDEKQVAAIDQKISSVQIAAPRPILSSSFSAPASKTKGLTKRWTHKTVDLSLVPREYLQLDEAKVKAAIAAGVRAVAGLEIYQDESITIR